MTIPNTPTNQAVRYIRRLAASDPVVFGETGPAAVVNIEIMPSTGDKGVLVLDLDDGTTIRIDVERYQRSDARG